MSAVSIERRLTRLEVLNTVQMVALGYLIAGHQVSLMLGALFGG